MRCFIVKRFLCICISLALIIAFIPLSSTLAANQPSDWASGEVNLSKQTGIITDNVMLDYQKNISREHFCELVMKLYEKLTETSPSAGTNVFIDTSNIEVVKAYELGIVKGISSNEFAPYNFITRQEICVMLVRCINIAIADANINDYNTNNFADSSNIDNWAISFVNYAYDNGIIKGIGNNQIDPLGNTTCEQAILLAYRIYSGRSKLGSTTDTVYELNTKNVKTDNQTNISYVNNIILIFFENNVSTERKMEIVNSINGTVVGELQTINQYQVQIGEKSLNELKTLCNQLNSQNGVLEAVYDMAVKPDLNKANPVTPADPWLKDDWNENNPSGKNWWLEAIQASSAWFYNDRLGTIKVGIVDNGFDTGHEDLKDKITFPDKIYADVNNKEDHGSHVAGIIGATPNNNKGITGTVWNSELICFDWEPTFLQEISSGWSTSTFISAGLITTVKAGAKVVNFSLGCTASLDKNSIAFSNEWVNDMGKTASLYMASLLYQGYDFVVVQSAGNGDSNGIGVDAINNGWFCSITRGNCHNKVVSADNILNRVIVVGAAERNGSSYQQAQFSNGGTRVDICAPGVDVYSTVTGGFSGKYSDGSGTSMAAPMVAGVAALVWSADPSLTGARVKEIVCNRNNTLYDVVDNPQSPNATGIYRMVNAKRSVEEALRIKPNDITDLVGYYTGYYTATQGKTGLNLSVYDANNGLVEAEFVFYPLPENSSVETGKYLMECIYNANSEQYELVGIKWIEKPTTYEFVDLHGTYDPQTKVFSGISYGGKNGTLRPGSKVGEFEVQQVDVPIKVEGTYDGYYTASQGKQGVTLKILKASNNNYEGVFEFYAIPENSNSKTGSYKCKIIYNEETNELEITGTEWIEQPTGYGFANFKAKLFQNVIYGSGSNVRDVILVKK